MGGFFNITNPSVGLITTVPGKPLNRELTPSIPAYVLTVSKNTSVPCINDGAMYNKKHSLTSTAHYPDVLQCLFLSQREITSLGD